MSLAAVQRTKRVTIPPGEPCPCGSGRRIADCCQPPDTGGRAILRLCAGIFLAFHVVALPIATVAAWFDLQTLSASGAVLSATGLAIAYRSFRGRRAIGFCYGLAVCTAAVICFALICGVYRGSDSARAVVGPMLGFFALVGVPLGAAAVSELADNDALSTPLPAQFSIRSLLGTMFFVALFFSCFRAQSLWGMALVALVGYGLFFVKFVRGFRRERASLPDTPTDDAEPPTA